MSEALEIQQVVDQVQGLLENLVTRGLRAAGQAERNTLATLGDELARAGAGHLAERLSALQEAIASESREGPECFFKAQASLRLFGRVLTLEIARALLTQWKAAQEGTDEPEPA
jgi:hypothetical protein